MCLLNELVKLNNIKRQYRLISEAGPAHKKVYTVALRVGDNEEYTAEGSSIKGAQHAAASAALAGTELTPPPPRAAPASPPAPAPAHHYAVMPTVELNALAMKLCQPALYASVPPCAPCPCTLFDAQVHRVQVSVGGRAWLGEGPTPQAARHDAAARALHDLRPRPPPPHPPAPHPQKAAERETHDNGDGNVDLLNSDLKSPVTLVYELAVKRNMPVQFTVKSESGPPHMRVFVTACTVGEIEAEGEGNGKKVSKRRAAERMLQEMRRRWPPALLRAAAAHPPAAARAPHDRPRRAHPPPLPPPPANRKPWHLIKERGVCLGRTNNTNGSGADNPISRLAVARHADCARSPQYRVLEERGMARVRRCKCLLQSDVPPDCAAHYVLLTIEMAMDGESGAAPADGDASANGGGGDAGKSSGDNKQKGRDRSHEHRKTTHPLTKSIKECIQDISMEGRKIRLLWLRAHVGTAGNERADELAKTAALTPKLVPDYDNVPLSYVEKKIREESVLKWQDKYESSSTGSVTHTFLPDIGTAYRIVRVTRLTPVLVQALRGHGGGIAEYLQRFKLRDSPGCECDETISESVWHVLLDCPRFSAARLDLESKLNTTLTKTELHNILTDTEKRPLFLEYAERAFRTAAKRNATNDNSNANIHTPTPTPIQTKSKEITIATTTQKPGVNIASHCTTIQQLIRCGEPGVAGLKTRGVALFMDSNSEKIGIAFCYAGARKYVSISPGLAALLNGSTFKTSMKRKTFNALSEIEMAGHHCRLLRCCNKQIALLDDSGPDETRFARACSLLTRIAEETDSGSSVKISVDAMVVSFEKGEVPDYIGCLKASKIHEVIVYEDRGENLSFLLKPRTGATPKGSLIDNRGHTIANPKALSGSERLQQRIAEEKEILSLRLQEETKQKKSQSKGRIAAFLAIIGSAVVSMPSVAINSIRRLNTTERFGFATERFFKQKPKTKKQPPPIRTRADMGQISPPQLRPASKPVDHMVNAFLEFKAITKATREVSLLTCKNIMQSFQLGAEGLLKVRLEEADAAIYNNDTCQVLRGVQVRRHMAAYNNTNGFVPLDEEETKRIGHIKFQTPPNDPIVVTAKCTEVMLDDRILEMAEAISRSSTGENSFDTWELPSITWVNGVPGCGKTTWVVSHFDVEKDVIVTTTKEAAKDLREKLADRVGADAKRKVRTMASVLVNGLRDSEKQKCNRLMVDEALMNHFGAIVMATRICGARKVLLIGDINQLPYIDKDNLFTLKYNRPVLVANVSQELLCTHRNPMDVAYALNEIYSGIYSSKPLVLSLSLKKYSGAQIPKTQPNTLYLVHTQAEKSALTDQGYGSGTGSRVLTVHEAQGLTYGSVVIVRTTPKLELHDSIPHAVVAISRHTVSCVYHTDYSDDAISRFIKRAVLAGEKKIKDYNLKMAIRNGDMAVMETLSANDK